MAKRKYDLIVIGAGPAGLTAVKLAASSGARVALIHKKGGGPVNADIPLKTLIHAVKNKGTTWRIAKQRIKRTSSVLEKLHSTHETYEQLGIDTFVGNPILIDNQHIKVGQRTLGFKKLLIATGSRPRIPAIDGLKKAGYETGNTILNRQKLPSSVAIIGGGLAGLEMSFALKNLGVKVHVVEHNPHVLHMIDSDAAELIKDQAQAKGILFHTSVSVMTAQKSGNIKQITLRLGDKFKYLRVGEILLAAGREASVPEGAEDLGMYLAADNSIAVNENWQTNIDTIYAVGDCTNFAHRFTPVASAAAAQAVMHALYGIHGRQNLKNYPYVLSTEPVIAQVGPTSAELTRAATVHSVHTLQFSEIDKSLIESQDGFIKICVGPSLRILSATVASDAAAELIGYLALAIDKNWNLSKVATMPLPYPTLGYGVKQIATKALLEQVQQQQRWYHLYANWHRLEKTAGRSMAMLSERLKLAGQSIGL